MVRSNLFLKIVIEHDEDEAPERIAAEVERQILKVYGVQSVELSSFTSGE